jgi:hypothetical protein
MSRGKNEYVTLVQALQHTTNNRCVSLSVGDVSCCPAVGPLE